MNLINIVPQLKNLKVNISIVETLGKAEEKVFYKPIKLCEILLIIELACTQLL